MAFWKKKPEIEQRQSVSPEFDITRCACYKDGGPDHFKTSVDILNRPTAVQGELTLTYACCYGCDTNFSCPYHHVIEGQLSAYCTSPDIPAQTPKNEHFKLSSLLRILSAFSVSH